MFTHEYFSKWIFFPPSVWTEYCKTFLLQICGNVLYSQQTVFFFFLSCFKASIWCLVTKLPFVFGWKAQMCKMSIVVIIFLIIYAGWLSLYSDQHLSGSQNLAAQLRNECWLYSAACLSSVKLVIKEQENRPRLLLKLLVGSQAITFEPWKIGQCVHKWLRQYFCLNSVICMHYCKSIMDVYRSKITKNNCITFQIFLGLPFYLTEYCW